jgi:hypothetical protein
MEADAPKRAAKLPARGWSGQRDGRRAPKAQRRAARPKNSPKTKKNGSSQIFGI